MIGKLSASIVVATMALGGVSVYAGEEPTERRFQLASPVVTRLVTSSTDLDSLEDWQRVELEKLYEEANLLRNRISEVQKEHGIIGLERSVFKNFVSDIGFNERITHARQVASDRVDGILELKSELLSDETRDIARRIELLGTSDISATFVRIRDNSKISEAAFLTSAREVNIEEMKAGIEIARDKVQEVVNNLSDEQRDEFDGLLQQLLDLNTKIFEKKYEFGIHEINMAGESIRQNARENIVSFRTLPRN